MMLKACEPKADHNKIFKCICIFCNLLYSLKIIAFTSSLKQKYNAISILNSFRKIIIVFFFFNEYNLNVHNIKVNQY